MLAIVIAILLAQTATPTAAPILDPFMAQQVYFTADPNNADRLGLATPTGRYSIKPVEPCPELTPVFERINSGLPPDQTALIWPDLDIPPWLRVSLPGENTACLTHVYGRMSETPCFMNTDGVCDPAEEQPMP